MSAGKSVGLSAAAAGAPGETVLRASGVGVRIESADILDDVDLAVSAGEVVALVGPNGAGKSTLLSVLAGDLRPQRGHVELFGRDVARSSALDMARSRAVLLQQQGLAFGFQARAVVAMGRAPWHGRAESDRDEEVILDAERRADTRHLSKRIFTTLSGGEQARVSFARILAQDTRVLLLDEPTAALDLQHQEAVLRVARTEAEAGSAVVIVLHDLSLAAAYADRVYVLSDGRVRASGTPREVFTAELLGEVYHHPVDVIDHRGALLIVPVREHTGRGVSAAEPAEENPCPAL